MGRLIGYSSAAILTGETMEVLENTTMLVRNGLILGFDPPPAETEVVDMRGRLLCPMFINSHTHIGDTGAKDLGIGLSLEESVIPPDGLKHRFLSTLDRSSHITMMRHGMIEMLRSGTVAFADFREQSVEGAHRLRTAAEGLPITPVILGRLTENQEMEKSLPEAEKLLSIADGLGLRDVSAYDPEVLQRLRLDYPEHIFAVHAAEGLAEELHSRKTTGRGQVARALDWGVDALVHLVHADPDELLRAAEEGVFAVHCPRSNGILGDGFANLSEWNTLGLDYCLGTDNIMFCSPDMLREMDIASRLGRGINRDPTAVDSRRILQAATIYGARMLKLEDRLGSLSPGKDASFIVFDLSSPNMQYSHDPINSIVHRASVKDIESVIVRGLPLDIGLE
ncbi:MAG: amidohydrolase family protein [Anaerolineales bacterium]|nr:amidohydrolase family protein [Anaerolineales bacterium]